MAPSSPAVSNELTSDVDVDRTSHCSLLKDNDVDVFAVEVAECKTFAMVFASEFNTFAAAVDVVVEFELMRL